MQPVPQLALASLHCRQLYEVVQLSGESLTEAFAFFPSFDGAREVRVAFAEAMFESLNVCSGAAYRIVAVVTYGASVVCG